MLTTYLAENYARFNNLSFFRNLHKSLSVNKIVSKNYRHAEEKIHLR